MEKNVRFHRNGHHFWRYCHLLMRFMHLEKLIGTFRVPLLCALLALSPAVQVIAQYEDNPLRGQRWVSVSGGLNTSDYWSWQGMVTYSKRGEGSLVQTRVALTQELFMAADDSCTEKHNKLAEIGVLWEALERNGKSFYNFGEANETAHVREEWMDTATGAGHGVMVPMQKALFTRTSHNYAGFNMNIPDQFRMNQFEAEFTKKWLKGKEQMPSLITMQVPNDHGASNRPEDGYLYPQSFMADNDLAVGRILHFLSRTPYWKNMLVIITEDDPQGGVDHIDAHRSVLMMAGPYVKRNYVSHTHANFGSIIKTIYNILGVPYVNQYDATASNLDDFFTSKPDFSNYNLELSDKRVFDPAKAMKRYKRDIDWKKIMKGPEMDDEDELREKHNKGEN
jgi:hypothetical protein